MINKEQAKQQAMELLAKARCQSVEDICRLFTIVDEETIEKEYGWIFFFSTWAYLETLDPMDTLPPGIGPVVVEKNGTIAHLGTGKPWDKSLLLYEANRQAIETEE